MSDDELDQRQDARRLLLAADLVWGKDEDSPDGDQILNMNDVWGWAISWGEHVPDEELPAVLALVRRYGYCGALYWVSERHDHMRSEFEDVNRFVEFVRQEEMIRKEVPDSSARAYAKRSYLIGAKP